MTYGNDDEDVAAESDDEGLNIKYCACSHCADENLEGCHKPSIIEHNLICAYAQMDDPWQCDVCRKVFNPVKSERQQPSSVVPAAAEAVPPAQQQQQRFVILIRKGTEFPFTMYVCDKVHEHCASEYVETLYYNFKSNDVDEDVNFAEPGCQPGAIFDGQTFVDYAYF